jgi:hypothetical protein
MNETLDANIDPSNEAVTPRKKTMSEAALAANRANALKSTGPRTAAGKLKAASNSLKHGLYSVSNFDDFIADHDIALAVVTVDSQGDSNWKISPWCTLFTSCWCTSRRS